LFNTCWRGGRPARPVGRAAWPGGAAWAIGGGLGRKPLGKRRLAAEPARAGDGGLPSPPPGGSARNGLPVHGLAPEATASCPAGSRMENRISLRKQMLPLFRLSQGVLSNEGGTPGFGAASPSAGSVGHARAEHCPNAGSSAPHAPSVTLGASTGTVTCGGISLNQARLSLDGGSRVADVNPCVPAGEGTHVTGTIKSLFTITYINTGAEGDPGSGTHKVHMPAFARDTAAGCGPGTGRGHSGCRQRPGRAADPPPGATGPPSR